MSCLANESILESLFEECLAKLEEAGHDINSTNAQAVAAIRAQQIFEEMG
tara:strand:+ start:741 stop:890 length:150 start_codon:yes stop_codon:yes gene_type:complete